MSEDKFITFCVEFVTPFLSWVLIVLSVIAAVLIVPALFAALWLLYHTLFV